MANKIWRGDGVAIAAVDTITVQDTWATNDTAVVTMNGRSLTLTVGTDATTTQIATAIKEMWNGETQTGTGDHTFSETGDDVPEFNEITATSASNVVTLTHDTAGVEMTITVSETTAGDGTLAIAESQAPLGPAVFDDDTNWDAATTPVDNDDMFFENTDNDLLYNLSQSGIGIGQIDIAQSYEGKIGLPRYHTNGYYEYRTDYLTLGDAAIATVINVGKGGGAGSGRIKINNGAGQVTINVYNTGPAAEQGIESFLFKGTHASNVANIYKGSVGIAVLPGELATIATLRVGYVDNKEGDAQVRCGSGVTLTTLTMTGGIVELNAGLTTITQAAGTLTVNAGNITTANIRSGTFYYSGTGTITTLNVQDGATLDLTRGLGTCTITNFNLYPGASVKSPAGRFGSAPTLNLYGCTIDEITLEFGDDFNVNYV